MAPQLLCFGNPLLDMCTTIETDDMLKRYGLQPANAILAEDQHVPIYKEIADAKDVQYIAGGAGQNVVRVAQWMLQTPNATAYVGCIGKDDYGKTLRAEAEKDGVNVQYLETDEAATGTCAVLVYKKDRSMVANLAAANLYKKDHFDSSPIQDLVNSTKILYITGFFLTVSPETAIAAATIVNDKGGVFGFNLAAPFLVQVPIFKERVEAVIQHADLVFGNETEALAFGRAFGWVKEDTADADVDLSAVAQKLVELPCKSKKPRTVVFTQGSSDVIVATAEGVTKHPTPPMNQDDIVDLNGAGDAFVGGFLSQLAQDKPVLECLRAGHYSAQTIIKHSGCTFPAKPSF